VILGVLWPEIPKHSLTGVCYVLPNLTPIGAAVHPCGAKKTKENNFNVRTSQKATYMAAEIPKLVLNREVIPQRETLAFQGEISYW